MSAAGFASLTIVVIALAMVAFGPDVRRIWSRSRIRRSAQRQAREAARQHLEDPGEVLRAERRAERGLLDALGSDAFEAYRALGFVHAFGRDGTRGYLIYPGLPIVSFDAASGEPLDEYDYPFESGRSDSADLLARWEALMADEGSVASPSNMHLLGRHVDPVRVRRDLIRLSEWTSRRPPGNAEKAAQRLRNTYPEDRGRSNL